ncbi:MAG: alanine racemase [Myxococcaceae bacterium]
MKALINLGALGRNLAKLRKIAGSENMIAMVKANAYGHGLVPVAQFLETQGVKYFGVATIEEGEYLRKAGIKSAILLMSGAGLELAPERVLKADLTPLVSSIQELDALEKLNKEINIHIDLDTGMSRGGFPVSQTQQIIDWFAQTNRCVKLEGLSTHFANAETPDCAFSQIQIARFETAGLESKIIHMAKSSAICNHIGVGAELFHRPGIALYGAYGDFEPVMSLKAPITLVKTISTGATVGYNQTWQASRETQIALIRAGYGDGYPRELSNSGHALFQGKRVPIIGRVSMDLITLDMTGFKAKTGDWVTLMGCDASEEITAQELAEACHTIPYEILTRVTERVLREYCV